MDFKSSTNGGFCLIPFSLPQYISEGLKNVSLLSVGAVSWKKLLEEISINGTLKYLTYFVVILFIIHLAISLWTEEGIEWATFVGTSLGGVIGVVIVNKLSKAFGKNGKQP